MLTTLAITHLVLIRLRRQVLMAQRRTLLWAIRTHMTAMRVVGFLTLMRVKTEDGSGLKVQRRKTELRSRFGALKHFLIVGLLSIML